MKNELANHAYFAALVSNGEYLQWYRDGRCYAPTAKRTTDNCNTREEAMKLGDETFADRDELDHIVIIEMDENCEYVTGE